METKRSDAMQRAFEALRKNGFEAHYFETGNNAVAWLLDALPSGASISMGGSLTLNALMVKEKLLARGFAFLDPWRPAASAEERRRNQVEAMQVNAFLCSANAVTESGFLLNVDGVGNRVASSVFGPEHVYYLVGKNKIVPNVEAAFARVEQIAPKNCARLGLDTPCAATGVCADCDGDARSCRVYMLMKRAPRSTPSTVLLIDEELGL